MQRYFSQNQRVGFFIFYLFALVILHGFLFKQPSTDRTLVLVCISCAILE